MGEGPEGYAAARHGHPPLGRAGAEGEKVTTTRLQKFVERGAYGEGPGRTAYVLDPLGQRSVACLRETLGQPSTDGVRPLLSK